MFNRQGRGQDITFGGFSPGHDECGSTRLYMGLGVELPLAVQGAKPPVGGEGAKPPEAESSIAFEAPVEDANLTLMTDSFLQFI